MGNLYPKHSILYRSLTALLIDVAERPPLSRMVLSLNFELILCAFLLIRMCVEKYEEHAHVHKQLMNLATFIRVHLSSKCNVTGSIRFPDVKMCCNGNCCRTSVRL